LNYDESRDRSASEDSVNREVIEEVQLQNSTYLVHKRKKGKQRRNLSDTSSESGIASQISESTTTTTTTTATTKHRYDDDDDNGDDILSRDELDISIAVPPPQKGLLKLGLNDNKAPRQQAPIAISSPTTTLSPPPPPVPPPEIQQFTDQNHNYVIGRAASTANSYASLEVEQIINYKRNKQFDSDKISQFSSHRDQIHNQRSRQKSYHTLERSHSRPASLYNIETRGAATERYTRPRSARTDILSGRRGYPLQNSGTGSLWTSRSGRSTNPLVSQREYASSCVTLPARLPNGKTKRRETFKSISAGSSISNITPNYNTAARSECSCGTFSQGLTNIKEEMPVYGATRQLPDNFMYRQRAEKAKYTMIFFIVLAAICCLVGGFLHFYVGYFPADATLNQGDVRLLSFSPMFCRGARAFSEDGQTRLITFESSDEDTKTKRLKYTRSKENFKIQPKQMWKRDFYLLATSEVEVTIETDSLLDIMIFQGENSMSIWEKRKESTSYMLIDSCCSNKYPRKDTFKFVAKTTDRYYIVLYSRTEIIPISIKMLRLQFDRLTYDFTSTISSCNAAVDGECTVEFPFTGNNKIAIEVPLQSNSNLIPTSSSVRYMCVPREWSYCLFFFGIFLLLVLAIIALYYIVIKICLKSKHCCCYRNDAKKQNLEVVYYDNYGRVMSELYLADQNFDSVSHARSYAPSRRSEVKLMYNDTASRSTRYPSRQQSHQSIRHAYDNSIASIYRDEYIDYAHSGLISPSGHNSSARDISFDKKNSGVHNSRYDKHQQRVADLIDGPSVKNLIRNRPTSENNENLDERYTGEQNYPHHNHPNDYDGFSDQYLQPMADGGASLRRSVSGSEAQLYDILDEMEAGYSPEGHIQMKTIDYDNREIFI